MSEQNGQQEPSMEEILASIRKIISEDEEEAPKVEKGTAELESSTEKPEAEAASETAPDPEEEIAVEDEVVSTDDEERSDLIEEDDDEEELVLLEEEEEEELVLAPEPEPNLEQVATIVSNPTSQAGVDAFGQLAGIIAGRMQLGQGRTVEELVQELLRPLLREWLDNNLPELVDELVKKEIERMVEKANR